MIKRMRHRLMSRLQLRESWMIFFIMGFIMMNFPFMRIFNRSDTLFGFPLMFIYLTGGWAVSICVIYLFTLALRHNRSESHHSIKEP